MQGKPVQDLFQMIAGGEMLAAARTIAELADAARKLGPDVYEIEEVESGARGGIRRVSKFWGWITHNRDGVVSIEPCLSVLEG
jgi:hypothetical protein